MIRHILCGGVGISVVLMWLGIFGFLSDNFFAAAWATLLGGVVISLIYFIED